MTILSGMGGILGPGAAIPGTEKVKKIKNLKQHSLVHENELHISLHLFCRVHYHCVYL